MPPASSLPSSSAAPAPTVLRILGAVAFVHLLNDLVQAVLPAIYPLLKTRFGLSFTEVGLITLTFQVTASLLQPWVGWLTDRHPKPFLLPLGMGFTLCGLLLLSMVSSFPMLLLASALVGLGSSTFHPEASRVARLASGGRFGFAQSLFQVGGNVGSALGPLLAAAVVIPYGQGNVAWFALIALLAIVVLSAVARWYRAHIVAAGPRRGGAVQSPLPRRRVISALVVLALLVFSKYFYMASITSYYTFYLIERFAVPVTTAQVYLFLFMGAVAAGTFLGGPIGDRIGRKRVIWISILGVAPFTLAMPYADLFWTASLSVIIGFVLASAFSAIVVYAQELVPGNVGMIAGVFFGLMFGIGGVSAAVLGRMADASGIVFVYKLCSFLPLLGLITAFLPDLRAPKRV